MSKVLLAQIVILIENVLGAEKGELNEEAAMDTTKGWDSLKTMEIVIVVEEHFGVTFTAKQLMGLVSAQSIYSALMENNAL